MKDYNFLFIIILLFPLSIEAQDFKFLDLTPREQLPTERILHVIQDREGHLWYATEGDGLCRYNGRHIDIFRNNAENPELLGSNNICSLAETGNHILIGTFVGAYVLNKKDYSIRPLKEVDGNRIDDILVTRNEDIYLTSNKKIYLYNKEGTLQNIYPSRWNGKDAYVSHIFEDSNGQIWATQWGGGLITIKDGTCHEAKWPLDVAPTDIADDPSTGDLWIGTIGEGIVRYKPSNGQIERQPSSYAFVCLELQLSADGKRLWAITMDDLALFDIESQLVPRSTKTFIPIGSKVLHRLSLDNRNQLLVSGNEPGPFVVSDSPSLPWYKEELTDGDLSWRYYERKGVTASDVNDSLTISGGRYASLLPAMAECKDHDGIWTTDGKQLYLCTDDSLKNCGPLGSRPIVMTDDGKGSLWYSDGSDIRKVSLSDYKEENITRLENVSALTFTDDGTLWIATVYGELYKFHAGKLTLDHYASNEYGDGVSALSTDSLGRLVIVSNHYIRLYDPIRHTLQQQSKGSEDDYVVTLQETRPGERWKGPEHHDGKKSRHAWLTSWWMGCINLILCMALAMLLKHSLTKKRTYKHSDEGTGPTELTEDKTVPTTSGDEGISIKEEENEFVQKAIAQVEKHMNDESYSVELLSKDLCMSRMTFYRKIQNATGQKPTEFIRTIRLRRAAELLREGHMSVTEISDATGFSSVSYFIRCFRTMYGVSPTHFTE